MLNHKEYIEHHRKQSKAEFGWIAENRGPVICKNQLKMRFDCAIVVAVIDGRDAFTIIVCVNHHLQNTQPAAGEVHENVANAPSAGALSAIIHECLRHILDQCNAQLNVTARVEKIEPVDDIGDGQYDQCGHT